MTVAPEPTRNPPTPTPAAPQTPRPELRLVPPETAEEITGPIPVIDDEPADAGLGVGQVDAELPAVTPQAPLDVRLLDGVGAFLKSRPRWSEPGPSMAEAWDYSTTGDWTTDEHPIKRVPHGLCLLVAFALTYPIEWAIKAARHKPIGFVLGVVVLFVLGKVL